MAVDPQSRNNILDGIKKLRDDGATIVYTTHYMEEAEALSDRIGIMASGKLRAVGTAEELIARSGAKNFEEAFIAVATGKEASV